MSSAEGPIGAAKGKQSDTEALCQTWGGGGLSDLITSQALQRGHVGHVL